MKRMFLPTFLQYRNHFFNLEFVEIARVESDGCMITLRDYSGVLPPG